VIGRANAGKTTILEKVCGVAQGTKPIIYDEHGHEFKEPNLKPRSKLLGSIKQVFNKKSSPSPVSSITHLAPSMEVSCMHMDLHPLVNIQL
jgi:hypothetical protein